MALEGSVIQIEIAQVPMSLGIPAMTVGGGWAGAHSPAESFDTTDSWKGSERVLLVVLANIK
jgi:hypothetical protein